MVSLYEAHQKIYPRSVSGRFARLRWATVFLTQMLFYGLPWLHWGERQAVLFDLAARRFYIFKLVLYPQDFIYLTGLLVISALSLFLFTAVAGRLWCGYACPQTVYTEIFLWIERKTEGDRAARMRRDEGDWNWDKLWRKSLKQVLWLAVGLWTGFTFVGYFTPIHVLAGEVAQWSFGSWEIFWVFFYGFATYGNAGYLREQVCKHMCPYARFQSAMFDRDTLIITYDARRGEPRGSRPRGTPAQSRGQGDCIDCQACVQVCPTGIDIRHGLQYECIACAACIDACDSVMDQMQSPRGLIRYTTQQALDGKPTRLLRPRMLVYGAILALIMLLFVVALSLRQPLAMDVLRDRATLYREVHDANGRPWFENAYELRVMNKDDVSHTYLLTVHGIPGIEVDARETLLRAGPGEVASIPVRLRVPAGEVHGSLAVQFTLHEVGKTQRQVTEPARFLAP